METIFTSLHILDLDNDWVKEKEVPASFAPIYFRYLRICSGQ